MRNRKNTWTVYSLVINGKVYYGRCKNINSRLVLHKHQCFTKNAQSTVYKWVRDCGITESNWDSNVQVNLHATCFDLEFASNLEIELTIKHWKSNPDTLLNTKAGEYKICNVLDSDYRVCTDCKKYLHRKHFCRNKAYPGGTDNVCKACKQIRRNVKKAALERY